MEYEEKRRRNRIATAKWRSKNREREVLRSVKYARDNPERTRATNQKWRERNPDKLNIRTREQTMIWGARQRAKERNLECDLENEDIVVPSHCPILGIPLDSSDREHSPSIDRVDNSLGYTKDNTCIVSFRANRLKSDMTINECKLILSYMEGKNLV